MKRARRRIVGALTGALAVSIGIPLAAAPATPAAAATPTELFFSEYLEGSSNNKALEIYNGTAAPIDLAAGGYVVQMYSNGSASAGLTIPLTGTVASGDVHVLAHGSADPAILAQADQTNSSGWFNGDDAIVLRKGGAGGEIVDVIGQVGHDPGSEWGTGLVSTADNTLRRKVAVCAGDTNPADAFDPSVEWDGFATNTFDGLGAHTCGGPIPTCPDLVVTDAGTPSSAVVSAVDDGNAIASIAITSDPIDSIALTDVDLAAGTAVLDVSASAPARLHQVQIAFTNDGDPPRTTTCTVQVRVDLLGVTPISAVQGSGPASPHAGAYVTIEGVVTSLFTSNDAPDGFFVQEPDADADADPATSEGLFVFCRGQCPGGLAVGDAVTVHGPVSEFFGMTQVSSNAADGSVTVDSSGNPLPTAAVVELPANGSTRDEGTFEPLEGMVVRFPEQLVVSEYFELARYGQIVLAADGRPYQFTHGNGPSIPGYAAFLDDLNARRIILDDDNNTQNDAVTGPDSNEPYYWPRPGLSSTNRIRGGDTITNVTGVLHWSFAGQTGTDAWRIRPIQGRAYTFTPTNPAPPEPEPVGGQLRVASFNVLNYFATVDTTPNDNGPCGPNRNLDCRGADSDAERVRQLDKIAAGLNAIDADVAGLIEIENDEGTATEQIVDALNARTAPETYDYIDTGYIGTDAIKVALIYQPASVTPVGAFAILDSSDDPRFIDTLNRPVLIQTFEERATGQRFTVAVNHLKSKGSDCNAVGDRDILDGQGNCSVTRTLAAEALADYLATDPTGSGDDDFLIIGDLNSYRMEDPIVALESKGYTDLHERFDGAEAYSYLFDGQLGYLDTALANGPLLGQVTGTTSWHINADEVPLFDYNDTILDVGEPSFERESNALPLYAPDERRSSDHDPVVVGLLLGGAERGLTDVRNALASMSVHHGVRTALDSKLVAALAAVDRGDRAGACGSTGAFVNQVAAQRGKKLSPAEADALTAGASDVRIVLEC